MSVATVGRFVPFLNSISRDLQHRLNLVVNTTKSHVVETSQNQFLGFTF